MWDRVLWFGLASSTCMLGSGVGLGADCSAWWESQGLTGISGLGADS